MPDLPWFVYAMLLAPLGLILAAAVYKSLQVRAAREWPSAAGKVVVSRAEVRKVKVIDSDRQEGHRFEERNFADIVYEYSVAGRKLRNNRVSIGEDLGNFQVAETIAKYPVGAIVTVYYNPLHPGEAVLERDLPKGMWGCLGIGTAIVLAIVFGSAIGLHQITEFVSTRIPQHGNPAAAVAFAAFGTVVALFALVLHRQASLAMKWPVVTGTIKLSDIEQYRAAAQDGHIRGQTMYQRRVSYTYTYNNLAYTNVHASLASSVASTSSWLVRKSTTAYQDGATVKVWVNPDNPSQATLEPRTASCGCYGWSPRRSGASRIMRRFTVRRTIIAAHAAWFRSQPKIRANRSAHAFSPAASEIRSWRISMPVFIRPRASPCTGMV